MSAKREQAERDGAPIDRLLMPSVLAPLVSRMDRNSDTAGKISYTLITRKGARLLAGDLTEGPSSLAPIDYEQVAERFYSRVVGHDAKGRATYTAGGVVVVPDRSTANLLLRKTAKHQSGKPLARSLGLADSLPASSRFVVLTEALQRKFFLPANLDENDITSWSGAFGHGTRRTFTALTGLLRLAMTGPGGLSQDNPHLPQHVQDVAVRQVQKPAVTSESYLMGAARTRSLEGRCSQFSTASGLVSRWAFLTDSDPIARAEAALDGAVFTAEATSRYALEVRGPFLTSSPP